MGKTIDIREHEFLLRYIYVIDVRAVNNKTATDADKGVSLDTQLRGDHLLELAQLEGQCASGVVGEDKGTIVAVRRDTYYLLRSHSYQLCRGRYDQKLLHPCGFDETKL